jgi:hypothetical protein
MKKILFLITVVAVSFTACKKDPVDTAIKGCMDEMSQNFNPKATEDDGSCTYLTSSETKKRNVVLEEFTGVRCQYCPDGHKRAQKLSDDNPGRVVLINVHTGGFANPAPGWPDFTTPFGPELDVFGGSQFSYPSGMVNRYLFPGANALKMGRGSWEASGKQILEMISPVNMAMTTKVENGKMIANVELYFTDDVPGGVLLNVAILESGVIGKQQDVGIVYNNYVHNHMLKWYMMAEGSSGANVWGIQISDEKAKKGTRIQQKFEMELDPVWKADNITLAAYVAKADKRNIFTGVKAGLNKTVSN